MAHVEMDSGIILKKGLALRAEAERQVLCMVVQIKLYVIYAAVANKWQKRYI